MNILAIHNLDDGMSNIACSGIATYVQSALNRTGEKNGKAYDFWTQFVVVKDSTGDIGINLNLGSDNSLAVIKGKRIAVEKGIVSSYTDNKGKLRKSLRASLKTYDSPPQDQQPTQQAPQSTNAKKDVDWDAWFRNDLVCAYIQAGKEPTFQQIRDWLYFITTGRDPTNIPEPDPSIQGDNTPDEAPSTDENGHYY